MKLIKAGGGEVVIKPIYTAGYAGHTPLELLRVATKLDALVIDTRASPRSKIPGWGRTELEGTFGLRYHYLGFWGNLKHKEGGPIEIANWRAGFEIARFLVVTRPLILLCVCYDAETCHRTVLANELRTRGYNVSELEWPASGQSEGGNHEATGRDRESVSVA